MTVMEALTQLVVGMSRFGEHLLKQKVGGTIVAALAFACGAGLASALKSEPRPACAVVQVKPADPARAEVSISDTPEDDAEEESAVFDKGVYENYVYGYSVGIPYGMIGLGSPPPAPQHGFVIDLDNPRSTAWLGQRDAPESYISADGSYNSFDWVRLDDAVDSNLRWLSEKGRNVRVRSRAWTRLGGLLALRVVVHYERGGVEMVNDQIVAFRTDSDEPSPVYTLDLVTPLAKYERDRPVLEVMQMSWCLQPIE